MTTTHLATTPDTRSAAPIGAAVALIASLATAWGAHTVAEVVVCVALVAGTAGVLFGVVVPRALRRERSGGTALALAIPAALLLLPAFWAGVPFVLAVAAVVIGAAGRQSRSGAGLAIGGLVLGGVVALGYLAIYVNEFVAGYGGFDYL